MHDWDLKTNIDAYFLRLRDQLFASDCCGFAATATAGTMREEKPRTVRRAYRKRNRTGWRQKRRKRLYALYVEEGMD